MFLKSLEMVGFKSFADKMVIDFHKGMTAIVGPNGCGKSNVLDSIRWVLGEQSAKAIRGGSMQDVIFGGADSRKPLGMAEVSLTFSECEAHMGTDFHEIRITRRVFRDGQSEYEINKTPCRLRDIHQLFMDTGIGRTAYSIMEQGKIDAILSSRPEERRAVFEEAAGITRFKSQKKEAIRKLELTETNLLRVTDVIKEVDRQIGSLQRQAAKAKKYKEIADRLRQLDTQLSSHQFKNLTTSVQESEQQVATLQLELQGLQQTLQEKEGLLRSRRIDLENHEDRIKTTELQKAQLENDRSRALQQTEHHQQRIGELTALINRSRLELASTEEKIRVQHEQMETLRLEIETISAEQNRLNEELQQSQSLWKEKKDAAVACAKERETVEMQMLNNNRRTESIRTQLANLEARQRSFLLRAEKLQEDEQSWESRHREVLAEIEAAQIHLNECERKLTEAEEILTRERAALEQVQQEFQQSRETVDREQSERARLTARYQALEQLVVSHAGYSETTKRLLERHRNNGLAGTLLEYLTVEPSYERAIEVCLGETCEALLVERPEILDIFLAELQDKEAAIFVSPEALKQAPFSAPSLHREAALRFVKAKAPVDTWITHLLANCYIVEDGAAATPLRERLPSACIVSKSGEIWHPLGWQLRGTRRKNQQSFLARENEMRSLHEEVQNVENQLNEATNRWNALKEERQAIEARLAEAQQQRQRAGSEVSAARYDFEAHQKRRDELKNRFEAIQHEKAQLAEQDHSSLDEQKRLLEEVEQLSRLNQELSIGVEGLMARLSELNRAADDQSQVVMDLRILVSSAEQRRDAVTRQEIPLKNRLKELEEALEKHRFEITDYEGRVSHSHVLIGEAEETIASTAERVVQVASTLEELGRERRQMQEELLQIEEGLQVERRQVNEVQTRSSKEEISLAGHKMHLDTLVQRVQRTYQVQIEEFISSAQEATTEPTSEPPNWTNVEAEVQQLREKLDSMGPVNLESIAEYEELEQRHQFLITQEKDLVQSKDQLVEAIKKINETTKVLFAEAFEQIQKNFSQIFVDLFGGGRASISLTDEQDPLESGIDIIAKPPGKQLQVISLLSGGEKTMTAVALLFAIYMVKPSPFCVLDEMDAPLDESNISRFIQMLQRFLQQSQFIVITHNKRTIGAADVLYGVTMEEHGVSKIVSVKLSRKEEDPLFNQTPKLALTESAPKVEEKSSEEDNEPAMNA